MLLKGIRVIDLTRLLPGPLCTVMMGDYGAEIIKIEDTSTGDHTRAAGPPVEGMGSFFWILNRNKKSVALNLRAPEGKEVFRKLAASADVLVEGFRPGVMERLGLGYGDIVSLNPRIVYASISGYGQQGPNREKAGHDINYTALAGILDLSSAPGSGPVMPAVQLADIGGGSLMALAGITMALYNREVTGRGKYVDVSMTGGLLPWLSFAAAFLAGGDDQIPRRGRGVITGAYACYNIYETAGGGYMSLGALEPVFWRNFCQAVQRQDWIGLQFDEKARLPLLEEVAALFKKKTREEWTRFFEMHDACCEPVLSLSETLEHPYHRETGFWITVKGKKGGTSVQPGFPLRFNNSGGQVRLLPPGLGEHTRGVLSSLGYTGEELEQLKRDGIIAWPG